MDCGKKYPPYVMDFNHRPGEKKVGKISSMAHSGRLSRLVAEITKCDVVCDNCHRGRTHKRR